MQVFPTTAGAATLLQFPAPPRVANFHATFNVAASIAKTTPDPSTTNTFPSLTTGDVKMPSVKGIAASRPIGVCNDI